MAQAFEEYVKAWFLLHVLASELALGSPQGFAFNMTVGYNLASIRSQRMDALIEGLKDASGTEAFRRCREHLTAFLPHCQRMTADDMLYMSGRTLLPLSLSLPQPGQPPRQHRRSPLRAAPPHETVGGPFTEMAVRVRALCQRYPHLFSVD